MRNYDDESFVEEAEETEEPKKKKRFNIFDWYYAREGKGVDADGFVALDKPSFKNFFKLLWRKLGKIMTCNLIFVFFNSISYRSIMCFFQFFVFSVFNGIIRLNSFFRFISYLRNNDVI